MAEDKVLLAWEKVSKLAALQGELRQLVASRTKGMTTGQAANLFGIDWTAMDRLRDQRVVVCGGDTLKAITARLERPDLEQDIISAGQGIQDKYKGLAVYSAEIIGLVFELIEKFEAVKDRFTMKQFAAIFGDDAQVVRGSLDGSRDQVGKLQDLQLQSVIREKLQGINWSTVVPLPPTAEDNELVAELRVLVDQLNRTFPRRDKLAEKLQISRGSLLKVIKGEVGERLLRQTVVRARAILAEEADGDAGEKRVRQPMPAYPSPAPMPAGRTDSSATPLETLRQKYPSVSALSAALQTPRTTLRKILAGEVVSEKTRRDVARKAQVLLRGEVLPQSSTSTAVMPLAELGKLGGETSPLGVRYVLGPDSFRELDIQLGQEFIDVTVRAIESVRLLLNLASQHKRPEVRESVRLKLGREIAELELAIRAFTAQFPNVLTKLHAAQRETWSRLPQAIEGGSRGEKR